MGTTHLRTRPAYALGVALLFWYAAAVVVSSSGCASCGDAGRQVATGAIVVSGTITQGLVRANRTVYTQATDTLGARVQGADYAREVLPLNAAFEGRSRALQALSADLYAAAALVDATRGANGGLSAYAGVARALIDAIGRDLAVLREGSVLPAIPIPPAVDGLLTTLRGIAGIAGGN